MKLLSNQCRLFRLVALRNPTIIALRSDTSHCVQCQGPFFNCHGNRNCGVRFDRLFSSALLSQVPDRNRNSWCSSLGRRHFHCSAHRTVKSRTIQLDPVATAKTQDIRKFLSDNDVAFSEGYTCLVTSCPRHVRSKMKLKELDKLYINMKTGFFVCHSCKKTGNWSQLKDNMANLITCLTKGKRCPTCFEGITFDEGEPDAKKAAEILQQCVEVSSLSTDVWEYLQEELHLQSLTKNTLQKYGVKVTADHQGLVLPSYNVDGSLLGVKLFSIQVVKTGEREKRRVMTRTVPRVDYHGVFGLKQVPPSQSELVLTASEFDALAVIQNTGLPAVALPKGDSIMPQQILPLLERFSKVVMWLGGDMKVWATTKLFAKKLNEARCYLIRPEEKSSNALKCLQQNKSLHAVVKSARALTHQSIVTFGNIRNDVFQELSQAEQVAGVKWKRYPQLSKLLKGHRRGELTIFTGPTGAGKTTFISDYSLDLCMRGVNTLWGSFEINNIRLMKTMLTQFSQVNLVKNLNQFEQWADQFEALSMYFMTFHGQENISNVIETMSHAVYAHDIAHVIVDNLQFMMGVESSMTTSDRFHKQDNAISAFRKFATHMNCHVTLVIHPRKEREDEDLTMASIFGSVRASQEADNVLILQNRRQVSGRGRKFIQVAKNRYDGDQGIMLLKFNKETLSFASTSKSKDPKEGKKKEDSEGSKHGGPSAAEAEADS